MEQIDRKFWDELDTFENEIIENLEQKTKNYTKEQFEQEYETAKNNLNAYSSDINLSRAERYKNWVELETTYSFYAKKLEAKGEENNEKRN